MSLARMQVERGSPYPPRACSPLAVYRAARLPGPGGAVVLSQRHARSFPLAAVPLSHLAPAMLLECAEYLPICTDEIQAFEMVASYA